MPTDGTEVAFGEDLPHGTEVLLTEVAPDDSDRFTWNTPTWAGDSVEDRADGSAVVTVSAATVADVSLTSEVTASLGSLELTKVLTGDGASRVGPATAFPVTLFWTDLLGETQQREAEVRAGTATIVDGLPLGTEVRVVEGSAPLPDHIRWAGVDWSSRRRANVSISNGEDGAEGAGQDHGHGGQRRLADDHERLRDRSRPRDDRAPAEPWRWGSVRWACW